MALFDLFGSKKPPVKKTVQVKTKSVQPKKTHYSSGPDCYNYAGSVEDYFADVLARNFPGYEIRRNVAVKNILTMGKSVVNTEKTTTQNPPAANGWTCACGNVCKGAFCPECGAKKPEPKPVPAGPWTCACGNTNKGNFCPECGAKRPVSNDWVCSVCGNKNKSKFCPVCGAKKPEQNAAPAPAPAPVRADEGPAVSFATMFEKGVAADLAKGRYPVLNFVIYKNGKPDLAILLSPKREYDKEDYRTSTNNLGLALRQKNIAFQRYFIEFRNAESYVCQRVREDLGL